MLVYGDEIRRLSRSLNGLLAQQEGRQVRILELEYELKLSRESRELLKVVADRAQAAQEAGLAEKTKVANWDYLVKCHEDGETIGLCVFHAGPNGELSPVSSEPGALASLVWAKRLTDVTATPVSQAAK